MGINRHRTGLWDRTSITMKIKKKRCKEDKNMAPMTVFLIFVGVCSFSAQLTKFLVWMDELEYKR